MIQSETWTGEKKLSVELYAKHLQEMLISEMWVLRLIGFDLFIQ